MSLLDTAKAASKVKNYSKYTAEQLELAQAWINGDITLQGVQKAMKHGSSGATYAFIAQAARELAKS